jgi:hypothetical protein
VSFGREVRRGVCEDSFHAGEGVQLNKGFVDPFTASLTCAAFQPSRSMAPLITGCRPLLPLPQCQAHAVLPANAIVESAKAVAGQVVLKIARVEMIR